MRQDFLDGRADFLDVRAFHVKFGQPLDSVDIPVQRMLPDQFLFRKRFLFEEADEYAVAYNKRRLVEATDALLDLIYVTYGTAMFMGAGQSYWGTRGRGLEWPSFELVRHSAFTQGHTAGQPKEPHLLSDSLHQVAHQMLMSHIKLFVDTHESSAPSAVPLALTALADLAWSTYWVAAMMSIPWDRCWVHVQNANMEKVRALPDGSNSRRQSGWDVVKPEGWQPPNPNIRFELEAAGAKL